MFLDVPKAPDVVWIGPECNTKLVCLLCTEEMSDEPPNPDKQQCIFHVTESIIYNIPPSCSNETRFVAYSTRNRVGRVLSTCTCVTFRRNVVYVYHISS